MAGETRTLGSSFFPVALTEVLQQAEALPMSTNPVGTAASETRSRLDELARRYYGPLLSFFRKRVRNAPEVHDLVQQVFLRLSQHGGLKIDNVDGYVFQTAANTLKDYYRRSAVRERFVNESGSQNAAEFPTDRVVEGREALAQVAQVLRQLPERMRDIFVLRCFEGLKYAEIAELQGIAVRSVEKHMAKALSALVSALGSDADRRLGSLGTDGGDSKS